MNGIQRELTIQSDDESNSEKSDLDLEEQNSSSQDSKGMQENYSNQLAEGISIKKQCLINDMASYSRYSLKKQQMLKSRFKPNEKSFYMAR